MKSRFILSFLLVQIVCISNFPQTDYYVGAPGTGPGGSNPQFSTLRQVCDFLNNASWEEGPIITDNIFITSDITEPTGVVLKAEGRPSIGTVSLAFSPMEGKSPVITFITCGGTSVTEYGLYINSFGISVKGLTFQGDSSTFKNIIPVRITSGTGAGTPVEISNCNLFYKSKSANPDSTLVRCALLTAGTQSGIINNYISSDYPGVSAFSMGIVVQNLDRCTVAGNQIMAKKIGIYWNGGFRGTNILNNEIIINQDLINTDCYGIIETGGITGAINIIGNKIILSKNNSMNRSGTGISTISDANIINNMISGFDLDNNIDEPELCGIRVASFLNQVVFNTIKMDTIQGGSNLVNPIYKGIDIINSAFVRNNIIVNEENNIPSYCIYFSGDFLDSDFNNLSIPGASAHAGFYKSTAARTLADWKLQSGQENNSVSIEVNFVSATDLHLAGTSIGDTRLAGVPIDGIITDIDREQRHAEHPYMGADEAPIPTSASVLAVNNNNLPQKYDLLQNYPNPFNPTTNFEFRISDFGLVTLKVYDLLGKEITTVINEEKSAGEYKINFNAEGLPSGIYFYRLQSKGFAQIRKMMVLK